MSLTQRLLGYLNRVFDKGPERVLVLRFRYAGTTMRWAVSGGRLTTTVTGGSGQSLDLDLSFYTVAELAAAIAGSIGYTVEFVDVTSIPGLRATVLIDASGDQDVSNGDHLYAYTSTLWAYLESQAGELQRLRDALDDALRQMAVPTAGGEWVDEHGSFYAVPRLPGEGDVSYASRMVAEVGRARGTNVAIAEAVRRATQAEAALVFDYPAQTIAGSGQKSYGLFDADVVLNSNTELTSVEIEINTRAIIEAMRDAGTHLRTLRYVRRSTVPVYAGAALKTGEYVTVTFGSLALDGSWLLNGSEQLDGVRG